MADGSLRIEVEVEPKDAQQAFAMFGKPGAPMALAALNPGYAVAGAQPDTEPVEDRKGGALARLAGQWCQTETFQRWVQKNFSSLWHDAMASTPSDDPLEPRDAAAEVIRLRCGVETRAMLDHNEAASHVFHSYFREPFSEALRAAA